MRPAATRRRTRAAIPACLAVALSACTVGPNYERPPAPTPAVYKEDKGWKPSRPLDAIDRGAWWSIYDDSVLDKLERQIDITNQNLRVSEAAYRQARAVAQAARATSTGQAPANRGPATGEEGRGEAQSGSLGRGRELAQRHPRLDNRQHVLALELDDGAQPG